MKNVGIQKPCSENWNEMSSTEKGAFCQKCATNVYDFSKSSNEEIRATLKSLIGQPVCGRITLEQEELLNADFLAWQMNSKRSFQSAVVFSLLVVFGLSLFSCSNEKEKEKIVQIQSMVKSQLKQDQVERIPEKIINAAPINKVEKIILDEQVPLEEVPLLEQNINDKIPCEIKITEIYHHHMLGAMAFTRSYENYLTQYEDPLKPIEVDENGIAYPLKFTSKVFPNPVSTICNLEFGIPQKDRVEISLYDLNGKFLTTIHSGDLDRGTFRYQVDMTNYQPGMYIVVVASEKYKETLRISKL